MARADEPKKTPEELAEIKKPVIAAEAQFHATGAEKPETTPTGPGGVGKFVFEPTTTPGRARMQLTVTGGYSAGQAVGSVSFNEGKSRRPADGPGVSLYKGIELEANPNAVQVNTDLGLSVPMGGTTFMTFSPHLPFTSGHYFRESGYMAFSYGGAKATVEEYLSPQGGISLALWSQIDVLGAGTSSKVNAEKGESGKLDGSGIRFGAGFGIKAKPWKNNPLYFTGSVAIDALDAKTIETKADGSQQPGDVGYRSVSTALGIGITN